MGQLEFSLGDMRAVLCLHRDGRNPSPSGKAARDHLAVGSDAITGEMLPQSIDEQKGATNCRWQSICNRQPLSLSTSSRGAFRCRLLMKDMLGK